MELSKDVQCPVCEHWQNIDHDDGQAYEQDEIHHQTCEACEYVFAFNTHIRFDYTVFKADCLNSDQDVHKWKASTTNPIEVTHMYCPICGEQRKPTPGEWDDIMSAYHNRQNSWDNAKKKDAAGGH